jgi:hypothetical protein
MTNIDTTDTDTPEKVKFIRRSYPDGKCDFLRHQVGIWAFRPEMRPVYDDEGKSIICQEETGNETRVFFLLGYGQTASAALRMARHAHARYIASLQ